MAVGGLIVAQLAHGVSTDHITVNTTLGAIKNVHAQWIISAYDVLLGRSDDIITGFNKSGILDAIN